MRSALTMLLLLAAAPAAAAPPARVVSLNVCTDQLAMLLAAPGQLVAVSELARDPRSSAMAAEAMGWPVTGGSAEEVFLLRPDLVLAGTYTTRATVEILRRLGIPVIEFAPETSFADIRANIAAMGSALGREAAAAALLGDFEAGLAALPPPPARRPVAILYGPNGYTQGTGTLADAVLRAAGFENLAARLGIAGYGQVPLERLVMERPDLVVTGEGYDAPALAQEVFRHPALAALADVAEAPAESAAWVCGTPHLLGAVRMLAALR